MLATASSPHPLAYDNGAARLLDAALSSGDPALRPCSMEPSAPPCRVIDERATGAKLRHGSCSDGWQTMTIEHDNQEEDKP
jgi:hypothetical protein